MKKKLKFFLPVLLLPVIILSNQFYCKSENPSAKILGNIEKSPLREKTEKTRACEIQDTFREIFEMYRDRVVFITTEQFVRIQPHPYYNDPFFREFFGSRQSRVEKRTGLGTGFVISEDGYVCTNHHVVSGVDRVMVNLNGKSYNAKIIGSDKRTDIALLKINTKVKLKPVYFGDSDDVRVGDWAIAIGNPFGLDKTFTVGVISAIGRKDVDLMGGSHIQTDASINPGNSGGPLINIHGEVIGINRMIYSKSGGYMGIGFAIPVNTAGSILSQLEKYKKIKRGYLGVSLIMLTEKYASQLGLESNEGTLIGEVMKGSPADKGGVRVGDVILRLNGEKIVTFNDLLNKISKIEVGKTVSVTVWRNGKPVKLYVKITERPD